MTQQADTNTQVRGLIEEGEAFRALSAQPGRRRYEVVVIGGAQSGLSVGYHLKRAGIDFVILDAEARTGDTWRRRWDSLRLFTPALYDGLDGMPFPGRPEALPTKDEMADYLESYAAHFELPILHGVRVERLTRDGDRYLIQAGEREFEAAHVVVAMASYQGRKVPGFAKDLSPEIVQLHSSEYRSLSQLKPGGVLLVGAGNSGAEIAMETAPSHPTWLSGRDTGQVPFSIEKPWAQRTIGWFVFRIIFHRVITVSTPIGRRVRPKLLVSGGPRIRQRRVDLDRAGVKWVARTAGVKDGLPVLEDGRTLDVRNVIWCTGFDHGLSWIDLPIFGRDGEPRHKSGVVEGEPGLYLVGQHFQHALSSTMIHGAGRDAARMVAAIKARRAGAARGAVDGASSGAGAGNTAALGRVTS